MITRGDDDWHTFHVLFLKPFFDLTSARGTRTNPEAASPTALGLSRTHRAEYTGGCAGRIEGLAERLPVSLDMKACPAALGTAPGAPSNLRWSSDRQPALRGAFSLPLKQRRRGAADMLCRTSEQHGGQPPSGPQHGSVGLSQQDEAPSSGAHASNGSGKAVNGSIGGNGAAARTSLPTETFKQLRHAVLTSLDIADNAENPSDYEDGGLETQENIALESCPSAKEVGKSVFEVSSTLFCVQPACLQRTLWYSPAAASISLRGCMLAARQNPGQPAAGAMHTALPPLEALAHSKRPTWPASEATQLINRTALLKLLLVLHHVCSLLARLLPATQTLRIDQAGKTRRVYVRRRDLIRAHGLQPRDLRRVDPSLRCGPAAVLWHAVLCCCTLCCGTLWHVLYCAALRPALFQAMQPCSMDSHLRPLVRASTAGAKLCVVSALLSAHPCARRTTTTLPTPCHPSALSPFSPSPPPPHACTCLTPPPLQSH